VNSKHTLDFGDGDRLYGRTLNAKAERNHEGVRMKTTSMDLELLEAPPCLLGEALCWSEADRTVYWADIDGGAVHACDHATGDCSVVWRGPNKVSAILAAEDGGLIAAYERGLARLDVRRGVLVHMADLPVPRGWRLNDAAVDPGGRVLVGSMSPLMKDGVLYLCDAGRPARLVLEGVGISNGMAFCDGGRVLLHTDSPRRTIRAYAYDPARRLDQGRPWYEGDPSNGVPDGCAQDAEGFIWVACWGGSCVLRLDRDGRIAGKAAMPVERISNVCFAGPALDWMYVTSAGAGKLPAPSGGTWRFRPGVKGKPETPARGFGIRAGA